MRLDPEREIPQTEQTVEDFWAWAFSDVLSNINRAVFAEWLVGSALGCVNGIRPIWAPWDLEYKEARIEVKSTSYHQNWKRSAKSRGSFDIKATSADFPTDPAVPVGPEAEYYTDPEIKRRAEAYVFAYYAEQDPAQVDPLNVCGWLFYVLSTSEVEEYFDEQDKVALSRVQKVAKEVGGDEGVRYGHLRAAVDAALERSERYSSQNNPQ